MSVVELDAVTNRNVTSDALVNVDDYRMLQCDVRITPAHLLVNIILHAMRAIGLHDYPLVCPCHPVHHGD